MKRSLDDESCPADCNCDIDSCAARECGEHSTAQWIRNLLAKEMKKYKHWEGPWQVLCDAINLIEDAWEEQ